MTHYLGVVYRLSIDGGAPIRKVPQSPWLKYEQDEIATVTKILKSGKLIIERATSAVSMTSFFSATR